MAQTKVNEALLPAGEKAQADITMVSMTIGGDANQATMSLLKLVSPEVPVSQGFADLVGLVNLASSLLDRAAAAPNADSVAALEKNFKAMSERVDEKLDIVDTLQPTEGLRKAIEAWLTLGKSDTIFDAAARKSPPASSGGICLTKPAAHRRPRHRGRPSGQGSQQQDQGSDRPLRRGHQLRHLRDADDCIGQRRGLRTVRLALYRSQPRGAPGRARESHDAACRRRPYRRSRSMRGGDEIGQMADALAVFREGIVQANAAAAEQAKEQEAKQRHAATIDR